jgi:hypothetical protein
MSSDTIHNIEEFDVPDINLGPSVGVDDAVPVLKVW